MVERNETIAHLQEKFASAEESLNDKTLRIVQLERVLAEYKIGIPKELALSQEEIDKLKAHLLEKEKENLKDILKFRDAGGIRNGGQQETQNGSKIDLSVLGETALQMKGGAIEGEQNFPQDRLLKGKLKSCLDTEKRVGDTQNEVKIRVPDLNYLQLKGKNH